MPGSKSSEEAGTEASATAKHSAALRPLMWMITGAAAALLVTFAVETATGAGLGAGVPPPQPVATAPSAAPDDGSPGVTEPAAVAAMRRRFADLYLDYLLEEYYTPRRGYCRPLLQRACEALLGAKLLEYPSQCHTVPSSAFVLAVGRFQQGTGLPVDGKAGPETVSKLVGGSFTSREAMAAALCPP